MKQAAPMLLALSFLMNFVMVLTLYRVEGKVNLGFRETSVSLDRYFDSHDQNDLFTKLELKNVKITQNGNLCKVTGEITNTHNQRIDGGLYARLYEDSGKYERVAVLLPEGGLFPEQTFSFETVVETDMKITKDGWGIIYLWAPNDLPPADS